MGDLLVPATKDDRASMEHPFFSIKKGGDRAVRLYKDERSGASIEILPSTEGSATIWDKDILIYLGTLLRRAMDGGMPASQTFSFLAHDLLRSIGRTTGGKDYKELEKALDRLVGTRFKTNIPTDDMYEKVNFSILTHYRLISNVNGRMERVQVTMSDWLYRGISANEVLTILPAYFSLTSGLDRRLYELVRKHCGRQPSWSIGIERLHGKSGSTSIMRRFRFELRERFAEQPAKLLDYWIVLDDELLHAFPDTEDGRRECSRVIRAKLASVPDTPKVQTPKAPRKAAAPKKPSKKT